MFGMNAKDAAGFAEDVAMINMVAAGAAAGRRARQEKLDNDKLVRLDMKWKEEMDRVLGIAREMAGDLKNARTENVLLRDEIARLQNALTQQVDQFNQKFDAEHKRLVEAASEASYYRERNADHVAIANATAATLTQAVEDLAVGTENPVAAKNLYLREIRTKNYNAQVAKLLGQGHLTVDPRQTPVIDQRTWFIKGMAPDIA